MAFHESEYQRLRNELESAYASSFLPENASAKDELDALLVSLRLER
jgi:hypothetical protein